MSGAALATGVACLVIASMVGAMLVYHEHIAQYLRGWWARNICDADPRDGWDQHCDEAMRVSRARHPAARAVFTDACPVCGATIERGPLDEHRCKSRL